MKLDAMRTVETPSNRVDAVSTLLRNTLPKRTLLIDTSSCSRARSRCPGAEGDPMSTKVASKAERGTKRTCQNEQCGSRFYDLSRDSIACPICNTPYTVVQIAPPSHAVTARTYPRHVKKVVPEIKPEVAADEEELPAIEAEEPHAEEDDDTLIEEAEEDPSDVSRIIDAPIEPDEKA
jgi:hypothetical protein